MFIKKNIVNTNHSNVNTYIFKNGKLQASKWKCGSFQRAEHSRIELLKEDPMIYHNTNNSTFLVYTYVHIERIYLCNKEKQLEIDLNFVHSQHKSNGFSFSFPPPFTLNHSISTQNLNVKNREITYGFLDTSQVCTDRRSLLLIWVPKSIHYRFNYWNAKSSLY